MNFTISRLAQALGLRTETVRHYRECGLLHPRLRENGYFAYDPGDALSALLVRELRSQEVSLHDIKQALDTQTMGDYCRMLDDRQAALEEQVELLRLQQERLRETQVYASCGVRILGGVEEFDGPPTWAVGVLTREGLTRESCLDQWVEHFPFTYVSITIPLEELNRSSAGREPYRLSAGSGALEKYVERFHLPLPQGAFFQPGGHFIRTCVPVEDVLALSPEDLRPLYDYAAAHHMRFVSHTGGRLLFIERSGRKPLYYVLVWVRVDPEQG